MLDPSILERGLNVSLNCSTSRSFVKKKAALTLLRLYRKHAEVIPAAEWALRIISIMDDQNLVRCSAAPFLGPRNSHPYLRRGSRSP